MPMSNQIYGKLKRILPNPDNEYELYVVIEKDSPPQISIIQAIEKEYKDKDIIISIIELKRKKRK